MESRSRVEGRVGYQLKRVQQGLRRRMDAGLRGLGLTTPQYAALSALEADEGLSGAELARRCFVTPQTMNGILVKLEGEGMISRRAHPLHGRVLQAALAEKGRRSLSEAHGVVEEIEERMLWEMSAEDRERLAGELKRCADSLEGS